MKPYTKSRILIIFSLVLILIFGVILIFFPDYLDNILVGTTAIITSLIATWIYELIKSKPKIEQPAKIINIEYLDLKSWLSPKRMNEIINQFETYFPIFKKERHKYLRINSLKQESLINNDKQYKEKPAWYSISRTTSSKNYRLTLGFRNIGCAYWRENTDGIGCLNCGYGSSVLPNIKITQEDLLKQFNYVRKWAYRYRYDFDVIEFLNDGSFLNFENEWPEGFPIALFRLISSDKSINRVLIESRPEFVTKNKIQLLLKTLREDQKLEVGIGLESSDDFIRTVCIRKGYDNIDFEKAIEIISEFNRCYVVVYSIIKPSFLTELESIEDIVWTTKYLTNIEQKYKIKIVHKLEPIVVAEGTLLEILQNKPLKENERYNVLSYWSVVEILCRIHLYDKTRLIRIGAREDMDIIERVSGIYNSDGTFNQYDFWCYDTIQKYNVDNDFIKFISNIYFITERDNSILKWKTENYIENCSIDFCIKNNFNEILEYRKTSLQQDYETYFSSVFRVLDELELTKDSHIFAKLFRRNNPTFSENGIQLLDEFISKKFISAIPNTQIVVNNYYHEKNNRQILRIYFDLINFDNQEKHDIWIGIPTK